MLAREWVDLLWPSGPPGMLTLWSPAGTIKHTRDPDLVAALVTDESEVFLGCGALTEAPAEGRGTARDVGWIPGVWLDVDHVAPWRKGECRLTDLGQCIELVHGVEPPTAVVQTGGGVHAWWLFEHPVKVDEVGRAAVGRLLQGWHRLHRDYATVMLAGDGGASIGGTHDLARVLRPVGSIHARGAAPHRVDVLGSIGGRYLLADLERRLPRWLPPRPTAAGSTIGSPPPVPSHTGGRALHDGPLVEHPWVVEAVAHRGASHPSNRAWDMAVIRACLRARATCSDQEIEGAVREHRRTWGGEERIREDDLAMSIDRARKAA